MKQTLALAIIAVVVTGVLSVAVLVALDKDPSAVFQMIVFVLPILVVQLFQGKQLDSVLAKQDSAVNALDEVQTSINGKLHGKLDSILTTIESDNSTISSESSVSHRS